MSPDTPDPSSDNADTVSVTGQTFQRASRVEPANALGRPPMRKPAWFSPVRVTSSTRHAHCATLSPPGATTPSSSHVRVVKPGRVLPGCGDAADRQVVKGRDRIRLGPQPHVTGLEP